MSERVNGIQDTDEHENCYMIKYITNLLKYHKYNPAERELLPEKYQNNPQLVEITNTIEAIKNGLLRLAAGDLSGKIEGKGSTVGALKSLQAILKHMTWQMEAVSKGDFTQSVDYLGEFSKAFEHMKSSLQTSMDKLELARNAEEEAKKHFKSIFNMIPEPTLITDIEKFKIIDYNYAYIENSGFTEDDVKAEIYEAVHLYTNDQKAREEVREQLLEKGFCDNIEVKFVTKEGYSNTGLVSAQVFSTGEKVMVVHVVRDISLIKQYEKSLLESERRIHLIFENSPIGILNYSPEGQIVAANSYFCNMLQVTRQQLMQTNMLELADDKLVKAVEQSLTGKNSSYEDRYTSVNSGKNIYARASFAPLFDEEGNVSGGVGIVEDFTERKKMEEEIRKMSITDKLTQLYNRLRLDEFLDEKLQYAASNQSVFSVILLDIDKFKSINDNYGHQVGDLVLVEMGLRLKKGIRTSDVVGRWGGEEFLIIAPDTDLEGAILLAEKIRAIVADKDFPKVGKITCSFGVAAWQHDDSSSNLISRADAALYKAKDNGRNRVEICR